MFQFKKKTDQATYLFTQCHYSAHKIQCNTTTRRKKKQQFMQKHKIFFTAKTEYLNLKAPSNKVKIQSDKITNYFFLRTEQMRLFKK